MDLNAIKGAFDMVLEKEKLSSSLMHGAIDLIVHNIKQALTKLESVDETAFNSYPKSILDELGTDLKNLIRHIQLDSLQDDLNVLSNNYLEILDQSFTPNMYKIFGNIDFDVHRVNQTIATHLYQIGLFELGDCFVHEAQEPEPAGVKLPPQELKRMVADLRNQDINTTQNWISSNRERLEGIRSNIELRFHYFRFLDILANGKKDAAIQYARNVIFPYGSEHMHNVDMLLDGYEGPRHFRFRLYSQSLMCPSIVEETVEDLERQFYCLRLNYRTPLTVTIEAGVQALPTLLDQIQPKVAADDDWHFYDALTMARKVDLDEEFQFHSVFICPVCHQVASQKNPPLRLPCGHVLCKASFMQLRSVMDSQSVKCPSCKVKATIETCQQLKF